MAVNLASIFQQAQQGTPVQGQPSKLNVYNAPPSNWGNMSDVQTQQNGVPQWIQNALGINAQSMDSTALNQLNTDYNLTTTRDGRNWNYNLADQGGNQIATHQYYDAPFSLMNDFVLPAATVWGGGYLGANALFGGAGAGAGAGGLSGMDLAADAALGTGNNIATAGSMFDAAGGIAGTGIPQFAQQPGYGQQFGGELANAGSGSPYTGYTGEVGGTGLMPSQPGAATGSGFNFSGATPGSVVGTGEGLGIASNTAGGIGAGLGAGIGASIPTGSALAGTALGGAGAGAGSGLSSQFLGNAGGGLGGVVNTLKNIPGANQVGNGVVSKLLGSVLGGTGQGVSGLANLGSLFSNYQQYDQNKDLINEIKGIYKPDGAYAKYMEEQLGRRDAAAGRNSQYGPRLAELMGKLGDSQARALSNLGGYMNSQQGGLNGMLGAGQRLFEGAGGLDSLLKLFGGGSSQGGMIPTPDTSGGQYVPNPDFNPVDDDWWSNPQYGP